MRANVLNQPALMKHAGQFAWLSINTEKAENEAFLEKFPVESWPTFYVVEPQSESPILKWEGSATVAELETLFADADQRSRKANPNAADDLLTKADLAHAQGHDAEALALFREALRRGGSRWPRRGRAVESAQAATGALHDDRGCAELAQQEGPTLPAGSAKANVAMAGLGCAVQAPATATWRGEAIRALEPMVREALTMPELLADDRSGAYYLLVEAREDAHDAAAVKKIAAEWLEFLEGAAEKSPTPEARAVFDASRLMAAIKLGDPARAVPALQASERDLPDDYNPSIRLAMAYREMNRYPEALENANRALAKVHGPRRVRVLEITASIYQRQGNWVKARQTLNEAIEFTEALPKGQRSDQILEHLRTALTDLENRR